MATALCIGINDYPGADSDLAGCVNDAQDWAAELDRRGFGVTTMLDAQASRDSISAAISELVVSTPPGSTGVITFSGHGTWLPDANGDEPDLRDEALCPYDFATANQVLLDDDLFDLFSGRHRGARIVFVSDSCHSGTVARMGPSLGESTSVIRYLPPGLILSEGDARAARQAERAPARGRPRGSVLLLSGCRDVEYSYDATFSGRPNGAFTRVALDALTEVGAESTYGEWHRAIRRLLPSRDYPQTPMMTATSSQRRWRVLQDAD